VDSGISLDLWVCVKYILINLSPDYHYLMGLRRDTIPSPQSSGRSIIYGMASQEGTIIVYLCLPTIAELLASKQHCQSTENVLPLHSVLAGNPAVQLERSRVGKWSLSARAECLSLQAQYSTNVQNIQIEKGAASRQSHLKVKQR